MCITGISHITFVGVPISLDPFLFFSFRLSPFGAAWGSFPGVPTKRRAVPRGGTHPAPDYSQLAP